ncbi:MAG TPA: type II secretion system protein [Phycisphaerales bacterium]|nr:type II secretion system protein [Phycisphaerales bacterium]
MPMISTRHRHPAFTLIELLVVISVIALLIGILLPSLGAARDTARSIVCQSRLRSLGQGQAFYMSSNKDYYAGPNTSGAKGQSFTPDYNLGANVYYVGDQGSTTPTSTHDWISPTLGDSMNLSVNRAGRTQQIFNVMACPSAKYRNNLLYGSATDKSHFTNLINSTEGFKQVSYLSPSAFHYKPNEQVAKSQKYREIGSPSSIVLKYNEFQTPVRINPRFQPRFDLLGAQASSKILAADGTRYFEAGQLDFDIAPSPGVFGSFTDPGAIFHGSTAYGRNFAGAPNNLLLSIRHRGEKLNAVMFDGHAETLAKTRYYEDASLWYPGGSVFNGGGAATPESMKKYKDGDFIN